MEDDMFDRFTRPFLKYVNTRKTVLEMSVLSQGLRNPLDINLQKDTDVPTQGWGLEQRLTIRLPAPTSSGIYAAVGQGSTPPA
jgi:hypothetical protein